MTASVHPVESKGLVLVVEDDRAIADLVCLYLRREGFGTSVETDGPGALEAVRRLRPVAVVLDIGLPGSDGIEVCRSMRAGGDWTPVLFVTARDDEVDRVIGLELGADDYVTKPFSTAELIARVRALLRRSTGSVTERILEIGDLKIDPGRRALERAGAPVPLTTLEFDVLYFLASRAGRVFSREALMEQVWGTDRVVDDRSIDSLISRVRRKLEKDPANPRYLQTVWGAGYRFAETSE